MKHQQSAMHPPINNENKKEWCKYGEDQEMEFLINIAPSKSQLRDLILHPNKELDKYETDFVYQRNQSKHADLKRVTTPFFKSSYYGYDPNHTVTINHKDYIRYAYKYPNWGGAKLGIIFWVTWEKGKMFDIQVEPQDGIWILPLELLDKWIRNRMIASHEYLSRQEGSGTNAKQSWLIDLRLCIQI